MSIVPFSSRREVLDLFQARLENTHQALVEDLELDFGQNMLKTHIIETNVAPDDLFDSHDAIQAADKIDSDLYFVKLTGDYGSGNVFLDTIDDRFWNLYSMEDSEFTGKAVSDMLSREGSGLDRMWLPSEQVESIAGMGEFEGVGLTYDADDVFPEEFIEDHLLFGDLSVNTSGHGASRLYSLLKDSDDIEKFLSLSNVQIRREIGGDFVRERVTNDGAFTTRGGSNIELHIETVNQIKQDYREVLDAIESNHLLGGSSQEHSVRIEGSPAVIEFTETVENIEAFLEHVVNARDPFRLWGHVERLQEGYYKVDGVDMHNGDKFSMEMTGEWIRLYLYEEGCGNTMLRIFTNLQHYYDPSATLVIADV
ncbi:hypothetical protein ACFQE8_07115 [Salinirubellus sp. GCM10025818]|uniref:hypothetical protein n=1 Tax=Salinirubellus TaxID=2162630 RepID=UPI0030D01A97